MNPSSIEHRFTLLHQKHKNIMLLKFVVQKTPLAKQSPAKDWWSFGPMLYLTKSYLILGKLWTQDRHRPRQNIVDWCALYHQFNPVEKSWQVGVMSSIYSCSTSGIIWIGQEFEAVDGKAWLLAGIHSRRRMARWLSKFSPTWNQPGHKPAVVGQGMDYAGICAA